jgi:hypothetical protein
MALSTPMTTTPGVVQGLHDRQRALPAPGMSAFATCSDCLKGA